MKKSNLHYTRGITLKRVTSGGVHLRGLALRRHRSDFMSDLTSPVIELKISSTDSDVLNHYARDVKLF